MLFFIDKKMIQKYDFIMMNDYYKKVIETVNSLEEKGIKPSVVLILGSGLKNMVEMVENGVSIDYKDIPNFPESRVAGHEGRLVFGNLFGVKTAVLCGRFHPYEGNSMATAALPVAVMKMLGAQKLIVTNAAGGVNRSYEPGDIMLISDHITLSGDNPIYGNYVPELGGEQFTNLTDCYSKELREKVKTIAKEQGLKIKEGVYAYRPGPVYETPAEIRMLETLGADSVGMSTIPETLMAAHLGLATIGISLITNKAAGHEGACLEHADVIETAERAKGEMEKIVRIAVHV